MGGFFGSAKVTGGTLLGSPLARDGFFGPTFVATPGGGGGGAVASIKSGDNSVGPLPTLIGSGEGFYDGATNGNFVTGSIIPANATALGAKVSVFAYQGGPTPRIYLILYGTLAQAFFTQVAYTDNGGAHVLTSAVVDIFSTALVPGFSIWGWISPGGAFPFTNAATYPVVVT